MINNIATVNMLAGRALKENRETVFLSLGFMGMLGFKGFVGIYGIYWDLLY